MERLRGAIAGFGFISSQGHMPAYRGGDALADIVAVADPSEARRAAAAAACPGARIYADPFTLIEAEKQHLDFLDVSTPPAFHAPIAAAALNAGLHVLCEKPLTTSAADAEQLLVKARTARRVLFPCHNYRHAPIVKAIREVIGSGAIGSVTAVTLSTFRNTHALGTPDWKPHWRRDLQFSGGGIAMDHGSHSFYLCFEWLGGHADAVSASSRNSQPADYNTEDTLQAMLSFPAGHAAVYLTWTAGVRKVIYTVQGTAGAITVDDDAMHIAIQRDTRVEHGSRGRIDWTMEQRKIASDWMDSSHAQWFRSLFGSFHRAIITSDFAGAEAIDALQCIRTIEASYHSASQSGTREKIATGEPFSKSLHGGNSGENPVN